MRFYEQSPQHYSETQPVGVKQRRKIYMDKYWDTYIKETFLKEKSN